MNSPPPPPYMPNNGYVNPPYPNYVPQSDLPPPAYANSSAPNPQYVPPPVYLPPENLEQYEGENNFAALSFSNKSVRRGFIRKVYMIMTLQLLVTLAFVAVFFFVESIKSWVKGNIWFYYLSFAVFLVVYFALICCQSVRRKFPGNFIALGIFTLAFSYMTGAISCQYDATAVFSALIITALLCIGLTIFAMQTKIDFTMCSGLLFALVWVLFLFGLVLGITYYIDLKAVRILHVVYGALGALLFSLFLVFDTQMIVGGRKHNLNPEDYIEGALQLYLDVAYIFLFILQIFGSDN